MAAVSLLSFCEWLAATRWSIALHESLYAYLIVLTVHVVSLCLFIGTAVLLDLRLLGMTMPRVEAIIGGPGQFLSEHSRIEDL